MRIFDVNNYKADYIKPACNLTQWARDNKPDVLINGSLYDGGIQTTRRPAGPPVGTVLENGRLVRHEGDYPGIGIKDGKLLFGTPWSDRWDYFMAGYNCPVLAGEYNPPAWKDQYVFESRNYRIGVGQQNGRTVIVTDDGVTLKQYAQNAIRQGVTTLVNLDGGGSRHLYYNGGLVYQSPRIPYNALAFYKDAAAPKDNACPYAEPTRTVSWWSIGEGAKWVQWQLTRNNYPCDVDGYFFAKSVAALKAFQSEHGLTADGICGPLTREELKK